MCPLSFDLQLSKLDRVKRIKPLTHSLKGLAVFSTVRFVRFFNLKDRSGGMQSFTVTVFVLLVYHTLTAFTTHMPWLSMWLLYTEFAQFATTVCYNASTDGSIPVLSSKSLLVRDTSNQTFFCVCLQQKISLKPLMQLTPWWHLVSRCARDVNEQNGVGCSVFL